MYHNIYFVHSSIFQTLLIAILVRFWETVSSPEQRSRPSQSDQEIRYDALNDDFDQERVSNRGFSLYVAALN